VNTVVLYDVNINDEGFLPRGKTRSSELREVWELTLSPLSASEQTDEGMAMFAEIIYSLEQIRNCVTKVK